VKAVAETLTTRAGRSMLPATLFVRDALGALDAAGIQEAIRLGPVTRVNYAPEEVLGIVNLRGKIVTIVDVGLRLGFPKAVAGPESRIFIIEDGAEFIGLPVDWVDEVVELEAGQWQPSPANVNWGQAKFFQGVCRNRGRVTTLLGAGQIFKLKSEE
jgi:purine-binding chemotaxis protein CheW